MFKRYTAPVLIALLFSSMDAAICEASEDTLVAVVGRTLDMFTNEPVEANIYYELLPHGNDVGILNTKDSGSFRFLVFQDANYKVHVKAQNYVPVIKRIQPSASNQPALIVDFYLKPLKQGDLFRLENLFFEQGKYELLEESYGELEELAFMLKENSRMQIRLEGHTDFRGSKRMNLQLSHKRARAVKDYLEKHGIKSQRISVKAFGGSHPVSRENTEEARKLNRRVEIRILKL